MPGNEVKIKWRPLVAAAVFRLPHVASGATWRPLLALALLLLPHVTPICYDQSPFWFVAQAAG
jgi:hypothetical protein